MSQGNRLINTQVTSKLSDDWRNLDKYIGMEIITLRRHIDR